MPRAPWSLGRLFVPLVLACAPERRELGALCDVFAAAGRQGLTDEAMRARLRGQHPRDGAVRAVRDGLLSGEVADQRAAYVRLRARVRALRMERRCQAAAATAEAAEALIDALDPAAPPAR